MGPGKVGHKKGLDRGGCHPCSKGSVPNKRQHVPTFCTVGAEKVIAGSLLLGGVSSIIGDKDKWLIL
jgi:hypothetical protein